MHVDSIFVGLATGFMVVAFGFAMFHVPAHSLSWGTLVLVLSIISIIFVPTNFVGAVLSSVAGLIPLDFKFRYGETTTTLHLILMMQRLLTISPREMTPLHK